MATTHERPDLEHPDDDSERTIVDGSPEDRQAEQTESRPSMSGGPTDADAVIADSVQPVSAEEKHDGRGPAPLRPTDPEIIGPYHIERRLGAGGMGTVYLGRHSETDQLVAVKVLSAGLAREPDVVERFSREIDAMRKLSGPHIVSLFEDGTDADTEQMYFAMEFVDGQTLGELLRERKRLAWDETVDIALQICTALKAAHAAGIVHRDLKPSNLLIGHDGIVHLTDFGVAQVFASQRLTVTGGIIGTAEFMSPEQAEGRRCTKKSDLYSLGAVIYAMLTGRPPFTGKTSLDILRQHLTGRFDRPSLYAPDTPRLLEDLVCTLLNKKPDDRHPDAHIVSLRLREVVRRVELSADHETVFRRDLDGDGLVSPTAAGRPVTDATAIDGLPVEHGPGPATLMRNVLKAELEKTQQRSPLAEFFDQTWVLVTSLALVIGGGIVWFKVIAVAPEAPPAVQARDDLDRFLRLATSYRRLGDLVREEQILRALRAVIQYDPSRESELADVNARLDEIGQRRKREAGAQPFAEASLELADRLTEAGDISAAHSVLDGLLRLYESDARAQKLVTRIRERLKALESAANPSTE